MYYKVVHIQKNGNNNVPSIYSKKICKKSLYRSNNGKKWNKYPSIISIPHKNMMKSLYICNTRLRINKKMEIIMFQAFLIKKYAKNHLIGQIMEKNEINIQVLFQFHINTWWKACIYVLQGCAYTKKWKL